MFNAHYCPSSKHKYFSHIFLGNEANLHAQILRRSPACNIVRHLRESSVIYEHLLLFNVWILDIQRGFTMITLHNKMQQKFNVRESSREVTDTAPSLPQCIRSISFHDISRKEI